MNEDTTTGADKSIVAPSPPEIEVADCLAYDRNAVTNKGGRGKFEVSHDLSKAIASVLRWTKKGVFAIADQGMISGTNFLVNIILARQLDSPAYGQFAIAFSVYILAVVAQEALVLEPMAVFASHASPDDQRRYVGLLLLWHVLGAIVLIAAAAGAAWVGAHSGIMQPPLASCVLFEASAIAFALILWLLRRALYLGRQSGFSPLISGLYSALMLVGLKVIIKRDELSVAKPFLLMSCASVACIVVLAPMVRPLLQGWRDGKAIWRRHWSYGRWALGAQALTWIPTSAFIWGSGAWHGMSEAGELRALFNLSLPMQQSLSALQLFLLPHAARTFSLKGWSAVKRTIWSITVFATALSVAYWGALLAVSSLALRLLYSGKYLDLGYLLPPMACASIACSFCVGPVIGFRACGTPSLVLAVNSVMNGFAVLIGLPLLALYGPFAALSSLALSGALAATLAFALLSKRSEDGYLGSLRFLSSTDV